VRARQDVPRPRYGAQHGKVRRRRGAGTTKTPVGGRRLGRRGHGARDTWVQGMGCEWRCGARGGVHGAGTGGQRPASACGPGTAAALLGA
jgi:hypothetical protein